MAVGSKLNNYIDDSFKANSDDDGDEIEEPKLLPHSLSTAPLVALVDASGAQAAGPA